MKDTDHFSVLLSEGEEYHETFLRFPVSAAKTIAVIFSLFAFAMMALTAP
ncbi:hypothetical protein [Falsigemmobacter faecalis]|nr:hypothetical protein [Falsigemmobacter faecalis]